MIAGSVWCHTMLGCRVLQGTYGALQTSIQCCRNHRIGWCRLAASWHWKVLTACAVTKQTRREEAAGKPEGKAGKAGNVNSMPRLQGTGRCLVVRKMIYFMQQRGWHRKVRPLGSVRQQAEVCCVMKHGREAVAV